MNNNSGRANLFDASALIKIYSDEPKSADIRDYFLSCPTKYTTPFCFYEAMNGLKGKWKSKKLFTEDQYFEAVFQLTAWYGASSSRINDLNFQDPKIFAKAKQIAKRHEFDLSDAFQILSIKEGYFSPLTMESSTLLVTADQQLAKVGKLENIKT